MISLNVDPLPVRGTGGVVVVIDTLHMSTTATVLGARGAGTLWIRSDVAQARLLAKAHEALLLGERNEQPLPGFDGGNSPLEYLSADLQDRSAILCTTNGSRAVEAAEDAQHLTLIRNQLRPEWRVYVAVRPVRRINPSAKEALNHRISQYASQHSRLVEA